MAEQSQGRMAYIAGIVALAVVVIVALVWRGSSPSQAEGDAGAGPDAAASDAGAAEAGADALAATEAGAPSMMPPPSGDAGPVVAPEGADDCRAYCDGLAERGELAAGATVAQCVEQLCADDGEGDDGAGGGARVPTVSPPAVPALPDDCRAQCQALSDRGELRAGMTLEQCYEALCTAEE